MERQNVAARAFFTFVLVISHTPFAGAAEGKLMDSNAAFNYISNWGHAEKEGTSGIRRKPDGDVLAQLASLVFQFDNAIDTLVVRAQVQPDTAALARHQDILQELNRIAQEHPERVAYAHFELVRLPWNSSDANPTLYLRLDYKVWAGDTARMFQEWRKLRETAYLWHRTYLREAMAPIVERRLSGQ